MVFLKILLVVAIVYFVIFRKRKIQAFLIERIDKLEKKIEQKNSKK